MFPPLRGCFDGLHGCARIFVNSFCTLVGDYELTKIACASLFLCDVGSFLISVCNAEMIRESVGRLILSENGIPEKIVINFVSLFWIQLFKIELRFRF